jgi:hypothetical protein
MKCYGLKTSGVCTDVHGYAASKGAMRGSLPKVFSRQSQTQWDTDYIFKMV